MGPAPPEALTVDLAARIRAELDRRGERTFLPGPAVLPEGGSLGAFSSDLFQPDKAADYLETSDAVYACAKIRADQLTTLDLRFYDRKAKKERREITTGLAPELFEAVNPFWTFNRFIDMTELSLCIWGESYAVFDRGSSGLGPPREIWWVKPTDMFPVKDQRNYIKGFLLSVPGGKDVPFKPGEVLWLRYPNPRDQFTGLSPLAASKLAADIQIESARANHKMHTQGVQLGGLVMPKSGKELSKEQTDDLERAINRRFSGARNKHRWGILRHEYEVKQLGVTPKDAEFLGGLRWSMLAVARAYMTPPELLADDKRCVDAETEALTARGWVRGAELTTDDTILSMDPADGQLKWSPVHEIFRRDYRGPMWRLDHSAADILVTPGHRFALTDGRLVPVEEIRTTEQIRTMGSAVEAPLEATYSSAFVELVGWAVTEGYYEPRPNRPSKAPFIRIRQKEGANADRIRAALKETGARWIERADADRPDMLRFDLRGEIAVAVQAVSPGKVMRPEFLLSLTADQRELLIETMIDADGCRSAKSLAFRQKDPAATDAFVMLCTLAGRSTFTRNHASGYKDGRINHTLLRTRRDKLGLRKRTFTSVPYEGMIWCPRTDYGTFVCRRGGKVYVTGNTYENLDQAMRFLWTFACAPEARFIGSEIVEQVLPMFGPGGPRYAEFDLAAVGPLREDEGALWERVIKAWSEGLIGEQLAHELLNLHFDPADRRRLNVAAFDMVPMAGGREDASAVPDA